MHLCLKLMTAVADQGLHFAFVVHHSQLLDTLSVSLLSQLLCSAKRLSWLVVFTFLPIFGAQTAEATSTELKADGVLSILVTIGRLPRCEADSLIRQRLSWDSDFSFRDLVIRKSGGYAAYIDAVIAMVQRQRPYITKISSSGTLHLTSTSGRIESMPWREVSPSLTSRLLECFDVLPPRFQTLLKVIACFDATEDRPVLGEMVADVTHRLVSKFLPEAALEKLIVLRNLHLLSMIEGPPSSIAGCRSTSQPVHCFFFDQPALRDTVVNLLTPKQRLQVASIALSLLSEYFDPDHPETTLKKVALHIECGDQTAARKQLAAGWSALSAMDDRPKGLEIAFLRRATELDVLLEGFSPDISTPSGVSIPMCIVHAKNFQPLPSLGPLTASYLEVGEAIRTNYVAAKNHQPAHVVNDSIFDRYHSDLQRLKSLGCPLSIDDHSLQTEIDNMIRWGSSNDADQAVAFAEEFLSFTETVVIPRAEKIVEWSLQFKDPAVALPFDVETVDCRSCKGALIAARKAPDFIEAVHSSMSAATVWNFKPFHPKQPLEYLRDGVLRTQAISPEMFFSFWFVSAAALST